MSFKKYHKGLLKKTLYNKNYNKYNFDYILVCSEYKIFNLNQYNTIQKFVSKEVKKLKGFYFIFVKPYFFLTSKPSESRMGGGKGNLDQKIFFLKKGQVIYGIKGLSAFNVYKIFSSISYKLPFKTVIIKIKY